MTHISKELLELRLDQIVKKYEHRIPNPNTWSVLLGAVTEGVQLGIELANKICDKAIKEKFNV